MIREDTKTITSVIIALNPKEATSLFKSLPEIGSWIVNCSALKVSQLGVAASNLRTPEVVTISIS